MSKQNAKSEQFKQLWVLMKSIINDPSYHEFLKIREESEKMIKEKYSTENNRDNHYWASVSQQEEDYKHLGKVPGMFELYKLLNTYRFYNLKLTPSYLKIYDYSRNMFYKVNYD